MTIFPGQKFSYLTVTARWSGGRWVCRCVCGGETIAKVADLKHGKVRSCGCVRRPAVAYAPKPKPQCEGPLGTAVDHRAWSPVVRRVLPDLSRGASALPAFPRATESVHAWSADQWRTFAAENPFLPARVPEDVWFDMPEEVWSDWPIGPREWKERLAARRRSGRDR